MFKTNLQKHVVFCPASNNDIYNTGSEGEIATVQYLVDNLKPEKIGDYRILVNYNLPLHSRGQIGTLEIDILVINRFGVFPVEVKTWRGSIEAYDGYWMQLPSIEHNDVFSSIQHKARVLHSQLFGKRGKLSSLGKISVTGLIVLVRGVANFANHSHYDQRLVVGLDHRLIQGLSSKNLLHYGESSAMLTDPDIQRVRSTLRTSHVPRSARLIRNYRIVGDLSPGKLFEAYEAVNVHAEFQRVRLKLYRLPNIFNEPEKLKLKFTRNAQAIARMGTHPNILQTYDFFQDSNRPDIFYEITELPAGLRLDEVMLQCEKPLPLSTQLKYLRSLCEALFHIHSHKVYHRNLSPQTVFVSEDGVQLGDFNYAKLLEEPTITINKPGEVSLDSIFTAPEMIRDFSAASPASDVYSLGVLWYFLASLPDHPQRVSPSRIDSLELPEPACRLMQSMLTEIVKNRPTAESVLRELRELDGAIGIHREVKDE